MPPRRQPTVGPDLLIPYLFYDGILYPHQFCYHPRSPRGYLIRLSFFVTIVHLTRKFQAGFRVNPIGVCLENVLRYCTVYLGSDLLTIFVNALRIKARHGISPCSAIFLACLFNLFLSRDRGSCPLIFCRSHVSPDPFEVITSL